MNLNSRAFSFIVSGFVFLVIIAAFWSQIRFAQPDRFENVKAEVVSEPCCFENQNYGEVKVLYGEDSNHRMTASCMSTADLHVGDAVFLNTIDLGNGTYERPENPIVLATKTSVFLNR